MKKGEAGHVEMILSFVIFIGFVVFLLYLFNPFQTTSVSDAVLFSLYDSFFDKASDNVEIIFINVSCVPDSADEDNAFNKSVSNNFYYVFVSNSINYSVPNCSGKSYVIGSVQEEEYFSYHLFEELLANFSEDYDGLKTYLKFPSSLDFNIEIEDSVLGIRAK
jgi:hypothetical protein